MTKVVLKYWLITRSGRTVTDADRKCFVITAAPRRRQNSGTRCVFGVPPARQILLVRLRPTPAGTAVPLFVKADPFDDISAAPGGLANASRSHSKLRAREALSGELIAENPALVPASARNRLSFTRVHSHARAQKSSGAFFRVMDRERCRKRPGRVRNALRASQGVRARGVMVNWTLYRRVCLSAY